MTHGLDKIELEVPKINKAFPVSLALVMKNYNKPHTRKFTVLSTFFWLFIIIPLWGVFDTLDKLSCTSCSNDLTNILIYFSIIIFSIVFFRFLQTKLYHKLYYQAPNFLEKTLFFSDKSVIVHSSPSFKYQSAWKYVQEVFEINNHIVISFGINFIVLPQGTFEIDKNSHLNRKQILQKLQQWHLESHQEKYRNA